MEAVARSVAVVLSVVLLLAMVEALGVEQAAGALVAVVACTGAASEPILPSSVFVTRLY